MDTNGIALRVTEAGDRGAPVVVLTHGFPELAYSWRHQIPVLADAGYHVLAPDLRGYGGSSRPEPVEAYHMGELTNDVAGLLDDVGAERAVIIGHDFGAVLAWTMPLLHPDRVAGVVGMSVPPVPRPHAPPTQIWRKMFPDNSFYILRFQEPGVADAEMNADPAATMRQALGDGDWLTDDDLDYYTTEFTRTGFTAPLNWYRNFDRTWELTENPPASTITVPSMLIAGTDDPYFAFIPRHRVGDVVKGEYREELFDGAGHWIQQERADEVNMLLLDYLRRLDLT